MLPKYVVHSMSGRARLRHPLLLDDVNREKACALLAREASVLDVHPGYASLLLLLHPEADLAALCAKLEESLPLLRETTAPAPRCPSSSFLADVSPRRLELRLLTGMSLLCVASAFLDSGKLHMYAGIAFAALAARHAWTRRKAL